MSDPQQELALAKEEVIECEKKTEAIKAALRGLSQGSQEEENSLRVTFIKTEGLPEAAEPSIILQLSSPIEEGILSQVFDPSAQDTSKMVKVFRGVETNQATLAVSAKDADIVLGDGKEPIDVSKFAQIDPMEPLPEYKSEVIVAIRPEGGDSKAEPVCRVHLMVGFVPSNADKKGALYEILNKITQRKAEAANKIRQLTVALSRKPASQTTRKPAVKPGFLNKAQAEPSWLARNFGVESFVGRVFPVVKNYLIFIGAVGYFHFKGQAFALLPPV